MELYSLEENRRLTLALLISAFLHLVLLISLELRPDFSFFRYRYKEKMTRPGDVIRFDLIHPEPPLVMETPEADKEEIPLKPTNIISDKNIAARDMLEKKEAINDAPYAEGKLKIKDVEKSIPSPPSIPQEEAMASNNQTDIEISSEKVLPKEAALQPKIAPRQDSVQQKETVASLPKENLRIPLYDDRLSNARGFGEVTFNAKKHDVAPYIIKMKKRIEDHWAPPVLFTYYGLTSGETVVQFKIMPDGKVEDVKVIKEKGDESLKKSSIQAILDAGPFDPIPPQILTDEKYLGITFTFYYVIDSPVKEDEENI